MLSFTPQIQKALGDAALVLDGDVLYIVNRTWMLVITNPERFIDASILNLVRDFDDNNHRWRVDWRVLCSREIDIAQKKFLPHRSRKFLPLGLDCWHDFPSLRAEDLRQLVEEKYLPSVWGDLVNLSAMFADGLGRAAYRSVESEDQKFAKTHNAETYQFRFDRRIICVDSAKWRAFEDLGLTVVCPKERYLEDHVAPPLGLRNGEGFDVVGYFLPEASSGVREDSKGRSLPVDAALACWVEEGEAIANLTDPSSYSLDTTSIEDQMQTYGTQKLRLAVSALRWQGWSDNDIDGVYEDNRDAAYRAKRDDVFLSVARTIQRLEDDRITSWALRNLELDIERYCRDVDRLNTHLRDDHLGRLPEAVALLQEVTDSLKSPTTAWRA